ncbi:hypothetical protein H2200_011593 [Cladophialophora chaetospira]|uniref:Protein rds1 n=1 Tax=Cladophialophora chaetospira TaxID=386627 RepID=A0AA39CD96_9EURO|nr:hypothetical protein H2200_011593 [Cladophialophora chaetospira]
MKTFTLSALSALFAGLTMAHPVDLAKRTGGFSEVDITILQFALTLEHLENTFYKEAFSSFQQQDFLNAGFDEEFFVNLEFIAIDESAHVEFLIAAIESAGVAPVQPCQYNFPVTDVASFVTVSAILESIGTSAYLGAAPFVSSKEILTVAASIMATEGLHTSLQRSALGAVGAANPFQTSLDANSVFTLASQFIVSCPPSNPPLPFKAFPGLKVNAQPCFNEVGSGSGSFETNSVNYATYGSDIETVTDTNTNYYSQFTNTNTAYDSTTTGYDSTTTTMYESTTTDYSSTTTTYDSTTTDYSSTTTTYESTTTDYTSSTTTDSASAAYTTPPPPPMDMGMPPMAPPPPPAYAYGKRDALEARTFQGGCQAPGFGQSMQLIPDFSQSRGVDFSQIEIIFVTIISGLDVISIQATFERDGSINVSIPSSISGGQIFIFITIVDITGRSLNDNEVLFGPAVFELAPSFPGISP